MASELCGKKLLTFFLFAASVFNPFGQLKRVLCIAAPPEFKTWSLWKEYVYMKKK